MEMQTGDNFIVRTMTRAEVDLAVDLAYKEGWNPGLDDAGCFYQSDPEGFLIGMLDNRPIGCISAVSYDRQFGFIGFYIVIPEARGKGYGIRLWQAAMQRLAGQNIGLDGVIAQESNYMKSGFIRAYRNVRFENISCGLPAPQWPEIVDLQTVPFNDVAVYDRQCFPAERTQFLNCWIKLPSSIALGYIEHDRLEGYGVIRRCGLGYRIGPLFADNPQIAERLYLGLIAKAQKGEPVFLDAPESNPAAIKLVEKYKMREVFATTRMYSRGKPDIALDKIFGNTTFELG
jgi:ribosomal protein S18 acetylase RimI-like enzyme